MAMRQGPRRVPVTGGLSMAQLAELLRSHVFYQTRNSKAFPMLESAAMLLSVCLGAHVTRPVSKNRGGLL